MRAIRATLRRAVLLIAYATVLTALWAGCVHKHRLEGPPVESAASSVPITNPDDAYNLDLTGTNSGENLVQ